MRSTDSGTRRAGTVVTLAVTFLLGVQAVPAVPAPPAGGVPQASGAGSRQVFEHRYRVIGKVRLLLFWASRDNVGSARMTARGDGEASTLTFLVGSDPQRAPRQLNEWSYVREEVSSTQADVFALSSLDPATLPRRPDTRVEGDVFGVSCASIAGDAVRSAQTRILAPGVTYRMFDRLLDRVAASAAWQRQDMPRPSGAKAGFLTAMQHVLRSGWLDVDSRQARKPVTYVYNNAVYDLTIRDVDQFGPTRVGGRTFDRLIRTDFSVRKRGTRDVSRFSVTYSPEQGGSVLPVQIFYQPSFWLRIELRLDDDVDAPADPAADGSVLARIRAICAGAAR